MTLAAPRQVARSLVDSRPLRHPDAADAQLMGKRGWWLLALNFLIPGSAQVLAGNRKLGRVGLAATMAGWAVLVVGALLALFARSFLLSLAIGAGWFSWLLLTLIQVALIGYAVLWLVLTIDTLRLARVVKVPTISRFAIPVAGLLVLALAGSGAVYAASAVGSSRSVISAVFGQSGPSLPPSDGYYNILLLGADSGEGRDSMRFDSISVVSINADSGAVTITGIPRELPGAPFREGSPMLERYPNGFEGHADPNCGWNGWMNHIRNAAETCLEDQGVSLYPDAAANGSAPGIEATKDAAAGLLGIEIPYYVFIDMDAFASLIDALGGVDINVVERLPKGGPPDGDGSIPAEEWAFGWIEAGQQHMDGDTAQWYARSRYTTSDYDRMKRQRELQAAILAQFTPQNVLARFNEVAAAGSALITTDLPQDKLPEFFNLMLKAKEQPIQAVELIPENGIDEKEPNFVLVRELVQQALHPPTQTPAPTDGP